MKTQILLEDKELKALVRLFSVAEMTISDWTDLEKLYETLEESLEEIEAKELTT
jgi:hypothetical protein